MDRLKFKRVDAAGQIIDGIIARLNKPVLSRNAPEHVARGQIANLLRTSQFCARPACRRSHCCRGEPLHCLQTMMPLLRRRHSQDC